MPHSFDVLIESAAGVDQIHAAFGREDYWLARIAAGGANATTTLDALTVADDGTVTVRMTQHVGRQLLPGAAAKFVRGDLKMVNFQTWTPVADGRVCGQSSISVPGGLGSGGAETWMTPVSGGTQLHHAVRVEVKIPLLGGKFEKAIGAGLAKSLPAAQRFTDMWLAEHA
jgi:Protein of unknown function (DUF2505)